MIDFPTELAILAKRGFDHHGAACVFPEFIGIGSRYAVSFCPNGIDNEGFKRLAVYIRVPFPFHAPPPLYYPGISFLPAIQDPFLSWLRAHLGPPLMVYHA